MIEVEGPPQPMSIEWYLVVSALVFCIGAGGILVRRNPLVILLCLELMLNAGNLALVAFARAHGNQDGQIFALIVMVVAACEVAVGLGLIVAIYRRAPADRRRRAAGAAGMSLRDLRLAGPAVPARRDGPDRASRSQLLPSKVHGCDRHARDRAARSLRRSARCSRSRTSARRSARSSTVAWDYANTVGVDAQLSLLLDPLSIFMALVVSGVSTLIHLYSVSYMASDRGYTRFFAYLNFFVFSMLLLVLAGNFFFLIVGWAFVGAASYLLICFWYRRDDGDARGHQGVRHQRRRRRRPRARHLLHLQARPARSTSSARSRRAAEFAQRNGDLVAGCLLLLVGAFAKSAQVPLHTWLPDAMEGPTPVSALIHAATMVTAGVYLIARMHPFFEQAPIAGRRRRDHRLRDAADRRHDRPRRDRPQARHRLLDDVADRLHGHGRLPRAPTSPGCST